METTSRPTRARGLKPCNTRVLPYRQASRPTRARGLKLYRLDNFTKRYRVAPHAGAWIETSGLNARVLDIPRRAPRGRVD